jgi:hypothetical protein
VVLGRVGLAGEGVSFGDELAVDDLKVGDSRDQLRPLRSFDFGAELEPERACKLFCVREIYCCDFV